MADAQYNAGKTRLLDEYVANGADLRAALLMTNTTADTENDGVAVVSDFTTLDEFDGSGYSRVALTGESVSKDDSNDRAELDVDDIEFGALGAGTRQIQGVLIYEHLTDDDDSVPLAWIEFNSPLTADGSSLTVQIDAEGVLQIT